MSAKQTNFPKLQVPGRSVNQSVVLVGKNGLPVDALSTLEPANLLVKNVTTGVTYNSPTVTVNSSVDLLPAQDFTNPKYTGVLIFSDSAGNHFFVDPDSINNTAHTFNIYLNSDLTNAPSSINQGANWHIAEAELVNRLQTTSSAVIDNVEFRDVDIQLNLTGDKDSVRIVDVDGDELDINPDGSINANVNIVQSATDTPTINNVPALLANTEYSFTLPTGTKKYSIKVRNDSSPLKLAFINGQSGSNYVTVSMGERYVEENINLSTNLTLYFQTLKASQTVEILYWE